MLRHDRPLPLSPSVRSAGAAAAVAPTHRRGASPAPAPCRARRGLRAPSPALSALARPPTGGCVCRLSCRSAAAARRVRACSCAGCACSAPSGLRPPAPVGAGGCGARADPCRKISGGGRASAADRLGRQRPFLLALPPFPPKGIICCHGIPGVKRPLSSYQASFDGPSPRRPLTGACSTASEPCRRTGTTSTGAANAAVDLLLPPPLLASRRGPPVLAVYACVLYLYFSLSPVGTARPFN